MDSEDELEEILGQNLNSDFSDDDSYGQEETHNGNARELYDEGFLTDGYGSEECSSDNSDESYT